MWEFEQVFSVISQMIKIILIRMSFFLWEPKNCWNEGFFYNRDDFPIPASVFGKGPSPYIAKVTMSEVRST